MTSGGDTPGTVSRARVRDDPGRVLWAVTGACWLLLVGVAIYAPELAHRHGELARPNSSQDWPLVLATFAGGWLVMVTAMMLPTTVPMVRMFIVVTAGVERRRAARVVFLAAYFMVWLGFAWVALAADVGVHAAIGASAWLRNREGLVLAGALGLAGVAQFTPLTRRCLRACRDPRAFLFRHYRRGLAASWALGVRHGLFCVGCCWGLMLVMFAIGVGSIWWMVALTAVMVIEKTQPLGTKLVAPVGLVLLAAGAWLGLSELFAPAAIEVAVTPHHH
jgi:predicted metal-binding membrane protein